MKQTATPQVPRWGMVVDLNRCVGCQTCTIACKHANDTQPEVQWRSVVDVEFGTFPNVERLFLVVGCQHCANPPCVPVCPTGATKQRADGLVTMDYETCIGCASCAVACPYQARTIAHDHNSYFDEETQQEAYTRHREREGVAQKCTFCIDRIDDGMDRGLTPGVDWDVTPACAGSCVTQAIQFGDFNDAHSNVSTLARENPNFQMHEHLGTDPQIRYLYSTPSVPGRDLRPDETNGESLADPANPLVGKRQKIWDWRAAMNWCFGGVGTGFAITGWLAYLLGMLPGPSLANVYAGAAMLMAIGLFFVSLKIGRPLRAWRAITRPQTSWMSRELYMAAVFFPAVLAGLIWEHALAFNVAGLAATGFLVCQAKILHMAKGIPAWRARLVPWMIFATGLLEGLGLAFIGAYFWSPVLAISSAAGFGIVMVAINAFLWFSYRNAAEKEGVPPLARQAIGRISLPLNVVGHFLPFVFFVIGWTMAVEPNLFLAIAGAGAIVGGMGWKYSIIVLAGYHQGYSFGALPQRGSGEKAAPHSVAGSSLSAKYAGDQLVKQDG
jgi:Fe-S-cluster-containing dehydrogenase component/DMSO reductase anchor subunit